MTISCPTNLLSPTHVLLWIACWRIILGIGIGGDYPMSSTITSDRAKVRKRGTLLAYVFANQGWGSFVGSIMAMIVLLIYRGAIEHKGSKIDGGLCYICFSDDIENWVGEQCGELSLVSLLCSLACKLGNHVSTGALLYNESRDPGLTLERFSERTKDGVLSSNCT